MWWPAVGGMVIGVGGLIFPRALGTGYDVIASLIGGEHTWALILGVLVVKSVIWSFSLGSGTSGGILAPLLMIGGALGALLAPGLPPLETGAWALVGMAAVLSGAIGCPLTATALAMELTHNYSLILPLLMASIAAHAFTVLLQRRSILTERLSRRGYHLSREYSVDPLETVTVSQVMRADADSPAGDRATAPIPCHVAYPEETLRKVAERMAAARVFEVAVVDADSGMPLGAVTLQDMLHARGLAWQRETLRQRLRRLPFLGAPRAEESVETVS